MTTMQVLELVQDSVEYRGFSIVTERDEQEDFIRVGIFTLLGKPVPIHLGVFTDTETALAAGKMLLDGLLAEVD